MDETIEGSEAASEGRDEASEGRDETIEGAIRRLKGARRLVKVDLQIPYYVCTLKVCVILELDDLIDFSQALEPDEVTQLMSRE